ncbi:MAG: triose-phosphate isomerase [Spirochaetes bacterium]|nr:triose-phosphate isomerase [Spirochaetota bacterium]
MKLIAGNWKMNLNKEESIELAEKILNEFKQYKNEILLCPPFINIPVVSNIIKNSQIKLGAQNMYYEDRGAFTGEISPKMLKDYGVTYVIIGHSERRHIFNEKDDLINKKVKKALFEGLIPILCVGELIEEREKNIHFEVVKNQVLQALEEVEISDPSKLVIAYEPVWAIGTGKNAEPKDAYQMHKFIREIIKDKYSEDFANEIRILYGGSVKPDNIDSFMIVSQIDGVLVGGASIIYEQFARILRFKGSGC